jgi:hypothetical protein
VWCKSKYNNNNNNNNNNTFEKNLKKQMKNSDTKRTHTTYKSKIIDVQEKERYIRSTGRQIFREKDTFLGGRSESQKLEVK